MAISGCFLISDGYTESGDGHRTYTYIYEIYCTDKTADRAKHARAEIPFAGRKAVCPQDSKAFREDLNVTYQDEWTPDGQVHGSGCTYQGTVTYSTAVDPEPYPWNERPIYSSDPIERTELFKKDAEDDQAVRNTAFDLFVPAPETVRHDRIWTVEKNYKLQEYPRTALAEAEDTVNEGEWNGEEAKHWLMLPHTAQEQSGMIDDVLTYWMSVRFQFYYKKDGHLRKIPNTGFNQKLTDGRVVKILNDDMTEKSEPSLLNEDGEHQPGGEPHILEFNEYETSDFSQWDFTIPGV